jgi:ribosomal protein S18 acetylase RimI-like enzyme
MRIEPADIDFAALARHCDFSFDVTAEVLPPFDGPGIGSVRPITPCRKTYPLDAGIGPLDATIAVLAATDAHRLLGYIRLARGWNGIAHIESLATDRPVRGRGIGRKLLDAASGWARQQDLAGLFAETQTNNLDACRFYQRCGFTLGGYDRQLYAALERHRSEVALFWYSLF